MSRPQTYTLERVAGLLFEWGRESSFNKAELVAYLAANELGSNATLYRKVKELEETGLIKQLGPDSYVYTGITPVSLLNGYADNVLDAYEGLSPMALVRALYAPVAVARAASRREVTLDEVRPVQRHIANVRQALLSVAELLKRMEKADLTDPDLAVIIGSSEAVERLTNLRKGFDHNDHDDD